MSILTEQLDALNTERRQAGDIIKARALLQSLYHTTVDVDNKIQAIVDEGRFDTVPTELKDQLQSIWQAAQAFRSTCEQTDNAEILNWS